MRTPTAASAGLERLEPFVGVWNTEGEMKTSPAGQRTKFAATDTYEWLPGGHFLIHRFDAAMPDGRVQGIEMIGYCRESDSFFMHSFDSTGNTSVMQGRQEKETWTFVGEAIRFTGKFHYNRKVFTGLWESRPGEGGAWQPWMTVTLRKAR